MFEEQLSYKSAPEKFSEDTENGGNNPKFDIWENFQQNCLKLLSGVNINAAKKLAFKFFSFDPHPPPHKMQSLVLERAPAGHFYFL